MGKGLEVFNFKSRKVISFFTTMIILVCIYFFTLHIKPELLNIIGVPLIFAIMGNSIIFIGGVVLEKLVNSKYLGGKKIER